MATRDCVALLASSAYILVFFRQFLSMPEQHVTNHDSNARASITSSVRGPTPSIRVEPTLRGKRVVGAIAGDEYGSRRGCSIEVAPAPRNRPKIYHVSRYPNKEPSALPTTSRKERPSSSCACSVTSTICSKNGGGEEEDADGRGAGASSTDSSFKKINLSEQGFSEPTYEILGHRIRESLLLQNENKYETKTSQNQEINRMVEKTTTSTAVVSFGSTTSLSLQPGTTPSQVISLSSNKIGYAILTSCRRFRQVLSQVSRLLASGVSSKDIYVFFARCKPAWLEELTLEECRFFAKSANVVPFQEPQLFTRCGSNGGEQGRIVSLPVLGEWGLRAFPKLADAHKIFQEHLSVVPPNRPSASTSTRQGSRSTTAKASKRPPSLEDAEEVNFFRRFANVVRTHPIQWKETDFRLRIYLLWQMGVMFAKEEYSFAFFLQDNVELSGSLVEYLEFGARVLELDNSLLGITAWNLMQAAKDVQHFADATGGKGGGKGNDKPNFYLMRQSHFANVAWMTSRDTFQNILLPFVSQTEQWAWGGDWSELMRLLVKPNRALFGVQRFARWGPELGKMDRRTRNRYLAPDSSEYQVETPEDKWGIHKSRVAFLLPSISLVRHVAAISTAQANSQSAAKIAQYALVNSMLERASHVAFWTGSISDWPSPQSLVSWHYDLEYLEQDLLGSHLLPTVVVEEIGGVSSMVTSLALSSRGQQETRNSVVREQKRFFQCAQVVCDSRPRSDQDLHGWNQALSRSLAALADVIHKSSYKGTVLTQYDNRRIFIVARYSPWWHKFCRS
ncbi:unnamed protein product [Amoebophrya sp. A25]|nr:unnamed protein product [Amoebophrya sp. A25]|eukprot:GSA25T00015007001.1